MKAVLLALALAAPLTALAHKPAPAPRDRINQRQALELACIEAERVAFRFEGRLYSGCEKYFAPSLEITPDAYLFSAWSWSGDCRIEVTILRWNAAAFSETTCY